MQPGIALVTCTRVMMMTPRCSVPSHPADTDTTAAHSVIVIEAIVARVEAARCRCSGDVGAARVEAARDCCSGDVGAARH
jgi:hypothetical protein